MGRDCVTEIERLKEENDRLKQSRDDYKKKWKKSRKRRDALKKVVAHLEKERK